MTDLGLTAMWTAVLGAALAGALWLRWLGVATTYVRDLLHVGAGVWVIGWAWWDHRAVPIAIVAAVAIAVASVPLVASRLHLAARFRDAVADGDERFAGLIAYVAAYLALTVAAFSIAPFPAAAGLLALSLGDGIGGAVGRRFGRTHFRTPFGKRKSLEGSAAVAIAATLGIAAAAALWGVSLAPAQLAGLGLIAAFTEAVAPRSSDNVLVPAAVWLGASLMV